MTATTLEWFGTAALQVPGAPSGYFALEYATPLPTLG